MAIKKYIFVTGGVCSSLGKGITAASIGVLLKNAGYKVNMMKIDPYINVDAGTMSPYQHGEVFVTVDGAETDLDLGNYERFVQIETTKANSLTTGQVYQSVIEAERKGDYLGKTVQVIPHITDEIKRRIKNVDEGKNSDIIIVELGGTVGDIESLPFLEAVRQFSIEIGRNNVKFAHLTLVPTIKGSGEIKTKPTQHSVKELMSMGIQPDFLFCRTEKLLPPSVKSKLALFCNIEEESIFSAYDVKDSVYEVPLAFHEQGADKIILEKLGLPYKKPDLTKWKKMVDVIKHTEETVTIALVGKYINLEDTYKSVDAALIHGGIANKVKVKIEKIDSEHFEAEEFEDGILKSCSVDYFEHHILAKAIEKDRDLIEDLYEKDISTNFCKLVENLSEEEKLFLRNFYKHINYKGIIHSGIDGILIPGGFGNRGIEGKIKTINYARENNIPIFGICLGMQCMIIEFARNKCGINNAHSREFEPTTNNPVIELLSNLKGISYMGGTMRKGAQKIKLKSGTLAHQIYGKDEVMERHRHRYEVNPEYLEIFKKNSLTISGNSENGLVEIIELKDHNWFLGCQFHPEFQSSPIDSHPLFTSFIQAAIKYKESKK
ncbi:MAG: CTP synthase [Brevinematales bacterium]|nr:CTP synthase [Brevinematales bacterium]